MPETSVILSTFNNAAFLADAIDSILRQTYRDFEFIIVDDGSTDATQDILAQYSDPRIIVLVNPTQRGVPESLNRALAHAQGEFIARMDGDDTAAPDRLARQIDYLKRHLEVGSLGTQVVRIDANNQIIDDYLYLPLQHSLIAWRLFMDISILHATTITRREILERVGPYNPAYPVTEDTDLWLRQLFVTRFANLPDCLYHYRRHQHSVTRRHAQKLQQAQYQIRSAAASQLLQRTVPTETMAWITASEILNAKQAEKAADLLTGLYETMAQAGLFFPDELELVRSDMEAQVSRVLAAPNSMK